MVARLRRKEGSPRRRGPLRRGHARLGEPKDNGGGLSSSPRRRWATPRRACDCLRPVLGRFRGSICDCLLLASGAIV